DISEQVALADVKNITIETEPGRSLIWRFPGRARNVGEGGPARNALLTVSGSQNVRIRGFTMEGRGVVEQVIYASGYCPGLAFENLRLSGGRMSGLTLANCAGTIDNPVSIIGLDADIHHMFGIYFMLDSAIQDPPKNQHLEIRGCQFTGPKAQACRQEPYAL